VRRHRPTVALVELQLALPGARSFVEALGGNGSLVVYGEQIGPRSLGRLLAAGSQAVALITLPPAALLEALREARAGRTYLDPALAPVER
jgi:DNA-binding NarL/FixJ family response regulator